MLHWNRDRAVWALLLSLAILGAVGCATHTEFGGRRTGFTADWGPPPPGQG